MLHTFGDHLQIMCQRYHRLYQRSLFTILIHKRDKGAINFQTVKWQLFEISTSKKSPYQNHQSEN